MIPAKEFEGELWIKAADFHRQKKEWVGLTDDDFAIWKEPAIGILRWAEATLKEKNSG